MLQNVKLVIDDLALRRPLCEAQPERLPHVYAGGLDPFPLAADQLAPKEIIQRLPLPLLAEPQRFGRLQIAHHGEKLTLLAPVYLIDPHLPQRGLLPRRLPALQVAQVNGSHSALRQTHPSPYWPPRRPLESLSHRLFEALAVGSLDRQLRHFLGPDPTARTPHPVGLHHYRRRVLKAWQVPHLPLADFVDRTGGHMLPAVRTNQLQLRLLPPDPELQLLAAFVNLHAIDPVAGPSQNPRPIVILHPLRLAKEPFLRNLPFRAGRRIPAQSQKNKQKEEVIVRDGGSASKPPGFCRCCARMDGEAERLGWPAIPAAGSLLAMLPSRALSPVRVKSV